MNNKKTEFEMKDENGNSLICTTLEHLVQITEKLKRDCPKSKKREDTFIPFEFVIGSLFPTAYKNIKDAMAKEYIKGYQAAVKEIGD